MLNDSEYRFPVVLQFYIQLKREKEKERNGQSCYRTWFLGMWEGESWGGCHTLCKQTEASWMQRAACGLCSWWCHWPVPTCTLVAMTTPVESWATFEMIQMCTEHTVWSFLHQAFPFVFFPRHSPTPPPPIFFLIVHCCVLIIYICVWFDQLVSRPQRTIVDHRTWCSNKW